MNTLDELPLHCDGRITRVDPAGLAATQMMAMGLLPGVGVRVVGVAPLGDPLLIQSAGCRLSLRRADAAAISITLDEPRSIQRQVFR